MFASNTSAANGAATYIEDVFSTWLYTGNNNIPGPTITNGVDLSGKGGMVWFKSRSGARNHAIYDTVRGTGSVLYTDLTNAAGSVANSIQYNSDGFQIKDSYTYYNATDNYVSWTFRKQPKFFDVVTYTGNGSNPRALSHNLGSVPGAIIVKRTDSTSNWGAWIQKNSTTVASYLSVNSTAASGGNDTLANCATSTTFQVDKLRDDSGGGFNLSGATYVAYLFAHNAGGFGLTGTDNVISCGSYTESVGSTITLGYEPQYLLLKRTDAVSGWFVFDTMRGLSDSNGNYVYANTSGAEVDAGQVFLPQATGFKQQQGLFGAGANVIYIAIRRGPMKTPTSGTSVLSSNISSGGAGTVITTGFPVDMQIARTRNSASQYGVVDRLRGTTSTTSGSSLVLNTAATDAEFSSTSNARAWDNTGFQMPSNWSGTNTIFWNFRRAPGFFDEVCWTGASQSSVEHGLGVVPELVITKPRSYADNWDVDAIQSGSSNYQRLRLNTTGAKLFNVAAPTATTFVPPVVVSGATYVTYLFASCPGVSKVGSYTGTGTTKQIDCGFTGGARFVLIKRTDSTGDWYVWDSARGIVAGNDPYLLLNSTAAEVTSTDYIDTYSAGFEISSTAPAAINASGGTFIYLAIA